jgi:lipoprotein-anchoring transpeptidase ErfK/SrfK
VARSRLKYRRPVLVLAVLVILGAAGWWLWSSYQPQQADSSRLLPPVLATADQPKPLAISSESPTDPVANKPTPELIRAGQAHLSQAQAAIQHGDLITARTAYSAALDKYLPPEQETQIRTELTKLADETIFSPRRVPGDPLTDTYVVQPGQTLRTIAAQFKVTDNLLAKINNTTNKRLIRAGQTLKVVQGPFHAVVDKSDYCLYVYLQDVLVRCYKVGLGANDSTPPGQWRVKDKLINPTYYPARGGSVIAADDPNNPLAERWIGLQGISGPAKGQERYGVHGTIDPDSIGKSVSMGCIRLHNPDVEELFDMLVLNDSLVTVRD